ncbi:MAG: hypothetical protein ACF8SC_13270 [Phycisphaerales bacterium JB037]
MSAAGGIGRAITLLEEQREVFERLEELARSQGELIDQDRTEELLTLMGERQELIERAGAISGELQPMRARWDTIAEDASDADREAVARLAEAVDALIARIVEADRRDEQRLGARRAELSLELGGLSRGRSASNAYAGRTPATPRYQDRRA